MTAYIRPPEPTAKPPLYEPLPFPSNALPAQPRYDARAGDVIREEGTKALVRMAAIVVTGVLAGTLFGDWMGASPVRPMRTVVAMFVFAGQCFAVSFSGRAAQQS